MIMEKVTSICQKMGFLILNARIRRFVHHWKTTGQVLGQASFTTLGGVGRPALGRRLSYTPQETGQSMGFRQKEENT